MSMSSRYVQLAVRTEAKVTEPVRQRLLGNEQPVDTVRILHSVMGLVTEAGEMMDEIKKHVFYNKPLDLVGLIEEAGDLFWYLALLSSELGFDFEEIMRRNLAKLLERYPERFSELNAITRDLAKERRALEGESFDAPIQD